MRVSLCLVLLALAACGDPKPVITTPHIASDVGLLTVHQARCAACHSLGGALDVQLRGDAAAPLASFANQVDAAAGLPDLGSHFSGFGMSVAAADDLRAWLRSLGGERQARNFADVSGGAIPRGEQLVRELACAACHAPGELELSAVTDHAQLTSFLAKPDKAGRAVAHVPLSGSEASAIAAWLLREQKQDGARGVGFGYECFELKISNGNWPDVTGLEAKARGVADKMNTEVATRKANYALQFESILEVPADGEWNFATRSDDGSWLWVDGELVVDNVGLKPATRKDGRINLNKGVHQLRVAYTQGGGGAELKVLWAGPGVEEQELPRTSASTSVVRLVPKEVVTTAPAEEAVARGRSLARAARCDACHEVEEPAFQELPEPLAAKAWSAIKIGEGKCALPAGPAVFDEVGSLPSKLEVASKLKIALKADGCLSCHVRDGEGGLPPAVRKHLREVEDIGEEGLVPPDLSSVGRRLRPAWLERVVREGHKSRDYVVMRMPAYGDVKAKQYAEWFGAVDAADVVDEEPPFSVEAAELGRTLAGIGGRNCISCHAMSGRDSLGPQGMDLAMQHQRLRPGWFRDWLLKPLEMRKNTRMPQLWLSGTEQDTLDVDAIRTWLSLGESAPLPTGVVVDPSLLVLVPVDRPILHGAFLKDVSARCLAVGTPARTHFAFDLVKPRLAWIWRGDFLDATGTWHGRAGKLVEPLGKDWQVVDDFTIEGETTRRLLGQRRTDDGYPVVRVGCGDARYEDQVTARLAANGSELVRVIRCEAGTLVLNFPTAPSYKALVQGKPASQHTLTAGQSLEVIYQW